MDLSDLYFSQTGGSEQFSLHLSEFWKCAKIDLLPVVPPALATARMLPEVPIYFW